MRQVLDRGRSVIAARIDQRVGAEFLGARKPLGADVERDDARAHRCGELRRRKAHRALADNGDGVAAGEIDPPQRLVGGAGAAGDRRAGGERQFVRQRHQRIGRYFHIRRMGAMAGPAIDDAAGVAHLRPAGAAVPAGAAAAIVMHHDAGADPDNALVDGAAGGGDDAARLVAGNDRTGRFAETVRR